jgi:hypothetical protein
MPRSASSRLRITASSRVFLDSDSMITRSVGTPSATTAPRMASASDSASRRYR